MLFPEGGGEATNPENIQDLYAYVRSWVKEEEATELSHPGR